MNERNQNRTLEKLLKILTGNFDLDDVEILLMNIRSYARTNGYKLLLEFCDFVAHTDREKGIIYDEIDIIYSKFKYMPINSGDQLDYDNIPKDVFNIIFQKAFDKLSDEFLTKSFGKTAYQLKNHITNNLLNKQGGIYSAKNDNCKAELRLIQKITNSIPSQIHPLSEQALFDEIKKCVVNLSCNINFQFDEQKFNKIRNNLILCFFEIIQSCFINLHDGKIAKGYITVGCNNSLYQQFNKTENLNLSFTAEIPIQQSFAIFELIQSGLLVGQHIPNPDSVIDWLNKGHTFGKLSKFNIVQKEKIVSI